MSVKFSKPTNSRDRPKASSRRKELPDRLAGGPEEEDAGDDQLRQQQQVGQRDALEDDLALHASARRIAATPIRCACRRRGGRLAPAPPLPLSRAVLRARSCAAPRCRGGRAFASACSAVCWPWKARSSSSWMMVRISTKPPRRMPIEFSVICPPPRSSCWIGTSAPGFCGCVEAAGAHALEGGAASPAGSPCRCATSPRPRAGAMKREELRDAAQFLARARARSGRGSSPRRLAPPMMELIGRRARW